MNANLFDNIVEAQHAGRSVGVYSVCSAHRLVLEAAILQARDNDTALLVESTSNQVNQFGGYTGQTPAEFAASVQTLAGELGLPQDRLLLGGDHLGPHPFRKRPAAAAMRDAAEMIRAYVEAGYEKIHLDTSMACAGDAVLPNGAPSEQLVAERAAQLCAVAEATAREMAGTSDYLRYVVGTEVPPPGGEVGDAEIQITSPDDVGRTIETMRVAFEASRVGDAWPRVMAAVVQPGVDFSDTSVVDYNRQKAVNLKRAIEAQPSLVYEAHSTDYQQPAALRALVEDHFAILKVGPWLTFAMREALFGLESIEREWLGGRPGVELSRLREVMDAVMLDNPEHWQGHYRGDEAAQRFARAYSYSDRIRYYWPSPRAVAAVQRLFENLASPPPLALVSQYLPAAYWRARQHGENWNPRSVVVAAIRQVLDHYAKACKGDPL